MRLELSDALKKGLTLLYTSLTTFRQQIRIAFLLLMFFNITGLTYGKAYLDTKTAEFDDPTFFGESTNKFYKGNDVKEDSPKVDNMDNHSTSHETFIVDNTPPTLLPDASTPVDLGYVISSNANIELVFSEPIEAGNANITVYNQTDDQIEESFNINTKTGDAGGKLMISDSSLTIYLGGSLPTSKKFHIEIEAGAVKDEAGNLIEAFDGEDTYRFFTAPSALITTSAGFDVTDGTGIDGGKTTTGGEDWLRIVDPGHLTLNSNLDGGLGNDTVVLEGAGSFDFTISTIQSFSTLRTNGSGTFDISVNETSGLDDFTSYIGQNNSTNNLLIYEESNVDLAQEQFEQWDEIRLMVTDGTLTIDEGVLAGVTDFTATGVGTETLTGNFGTTADLSGRDLSGFEVIKNTARNSTTFKIDENTQFDDVTEFATSDPIGSDVLETAGSELDVSDITLTNINTLTTSNTDGTNFTGTDNSDTIIGAGGDDTINGGLGADELTGGGGENTFIGTADELNEDTITDLGLTDEIVIEGEESSVDGIFIQFDSSTNTLTLDTNNDDTFDSSDMTLTFSGNSPDGFQAHTDAGNAVITRDPAEIIYVDADAAGASDGTSWADAYTSLQNALDDATGNDQIWIAEGTYYPDEGANVTDGDESAYFTITGDQDGLKVYGGFDGTESQLDERDISGHATILSGDIDGDDTKTNGITMDADDISGTNSNNVLFLDAGDVYEGGNEVDPNITTNTELDGLIVTGGQANGSSFDRYGGGLYCDGLGSSNECSPTLRNIIFIGNQASLQGGAIYNNGRGSGTSSPVLTNAIFYGNQGSYGGVIANNGGDNGTSIPKIKNVIFTNNSADDYAGVLYNSGSSGTSNPIITNTIFYGNTASKDGNQIYNAEATSTISYSLIEGGVNGSGVHGDPNDDGGNNIDANPKFVDSANPAGPDGEWFTDDDGLVLQPSSSAVDAGDNDAIPSGVTTDIAGNQRTRGGTVDMGAYESEPNEPPSASNITVSGTRQVGEQLSASYDYSDPEDDSESGSSYQWYRSDDNTGTNRTAISGATSKTYTLSVADTDKYISFEVTPSDGISEGTAKESAFEGPIAAPFSGGSGTKADPYQIETLDQLQAVKDYLDKHFVQTADIDASPTQTWNSDGAGGYEGFKCIGKDANKFAESYDGQGHTINDLFINETGTTEGDGIGLFCDTGENSTITDVHLVDANITGKKSAGALVGIHQGSVSNSSATGAVTVTGLFGGGLVGAMDSEATVGTSYADVKVEAQDDAGGLIGFHNGKEISNSYASGSVTTNGNAGGLVAQIYSGTVKNSYAIGEVSGNNQTGGLVAENRNTVTDSFWDSQTTGQSSGDGGTPLSTDDMKNRATFSNAGWDLSSTWAVSPDLNSGYPQLRHFVSNVPPIFSSAGSVDVDENTTTVLDINATDGDGGAADDGISYAITGGDDQNLFSIDAESGNLTFDSAPDFEQPGDENTDNEYVVEVTADDGQSTNNTTTKEFVITVNDQNEQPEFTSQNSATVDENSSGTVLNIEATDGDGGRPDQNITYSITGSDSNLFSIDDQSGELSFANSPDFEQPADSDADNRYELQVEANDGTKKASQNIELTVADVRPAMDDQTVGSINETVSTGTAVGTISTTDDTPTRFAITDGNTDDAFAVDSNGQITVADESVIDYETISQYDLTVEANDKSSGKGVTATITININDVDESPVFVSPNTTSFQENSTDAVLDVDANDGEDNDPDENVTYSIKSEDDGNLFTIDTQTGVLEFVSPPDYEQPEDQDSDNKYIVDVEVNDGSKTSTQTVTVTVKNANDDPKISGSPDNEVDEDASYSFTPKASDPEGDELTFSIANKPGWSSFDTETGQLSGTPANADVGTVEEIKITVEDGNGGSASLSAFDITVNNINDAPTITAIDDQTILEDDTAGPISFSIGDVDNAISGLALEATSSNKDLLPDENIKLSGSGKDRTIELQPEQNANGQTTVTITVDDGKISEETSFGLTVKAVNDDPKISGTPDTEVDEDAPYSFTPKASDPEGDELTFSIANKPDWASFDTETGELSGTPVNADVGTIEDIKITVEDGNGGSASLSAFDITVNNTNDPPVVHEGIGDQTAKENTSFTFTIPDNAFKDVDPGDNLTLSVSGLPDGLTFDESTAKISGTPNKVDVGKHTVTVTATDESQKTANTTFELIVEAAIPEQITLVGPVDQKEDIVLLPTLEWEKESVSQHYNVQLATSADFNTGDIVFDADDITDTNVSLSTALTRNTVYYWRVRGENEGVTGDWSKVFSFTTIPAAPKQVSLVLPADESSDKPLEPNFEWDEAAGADTYQFEIAKEKSFSDGSIIEEQASLSETETVLNTTLNRETTYYWRVRGSNAGGNGEWSSNYQFRTLPVLPARVELESPDNGSGSIVLDDNLIWKSVERADTYSLEVATDEAFSDIVVSEDELHDSQYAMDNQLSANTTYFWRVRASNSAGSGEWSEGYNFTTVAASPTMAFPGDGEEGISIAPRLSWQSEYNSSLYRVKVATDSEFQSLVADTLVENSYLDIEGLDTETEYYWQVRVENDQTTSAYSPQQSFVTRTPPEEDTEQQQISFGDSDGEDGTGGADRDLSANDYRLIGLPGSSNTPVDELFEGEYGKDWKVFSDNGEQEDFLVEHSGDNPLTFTEGRGFWILSKKPLTVGGNVEQVQISEEDTYSINLKPGWNIVTNPFTRAVDWQQVQEFNNQKLTLFGYEGSFYESETMEPFFAYYLHNESDKDITAKIPYTSLEKKRKNNKQEKTSQGKISSKPGRISLDISKVDRERSVSLHLVYDNDPERRKSTTKFMPPLKLSKFGAAIIDDDNPKRKKMLQTAGDVFDRDRKKYTVEIKADKKGKTEWTPSISGFDTPMAVLVVEPEKGRTKILSNGEHYSFMAAKGRKKFKVFTGTVSELEKVEDNLLPQEMALNQNYPNPFNPSTTIQFGIDQQSDVRLEVYNILGQKVRTLVNETMKAGWHRVTFDGSRLASGTYFYRLMVGEKMKTKKMVLIK